MITFKLFLMSACQNTFGLIWSIYTHHPFAYEFNSRCWSLLSKPFMVWGTHILERSSFPLWTQLAASLSQKIPPPPVCSFHIADYICGPRSPGTTYQRMSERHCYLGWLLNLNRLGGGVTWRRLRILSFLGILCFVASFTIVAGLCEVLPIFFWVFTLWKLPWALPEVKREDKINE